jgi:hypothetical protein
MIEQLKKRIQLQADFLLENLSGDIREGEKRERKRELFSRRNCRLVKVRATGKIKNRRKEPDGETVLYQVHYRYLINQLGHSYLEEELEERRAYFSGGRLVSDVEWPPAAEGNPGGNDRPFPLPEESLPRVPFIYDRRLAVRYAERWWNSHNPQYQKFENDCTNYISQCLRAGGAPMRGYPDRGKGWWYRGKSWSYSWAVANALRNYLDTSKAGLRARKVDDPRELQPGDVICYDFEGDGRFNHNTIVTAKDAFGYPLVNAHTTNSRMRYWSYEDSTAYTKNIRYNFFHIVDDRT